MKKIILFILLISFPTYSYAAWACPIKDQTAQALLDYINDNRKIIKNITDEIVKEKNNISKKVTEDKKKEKSELDKQIWWIKDQLNKKVDEVKNAGNELVSIFNEMFNFNWYISYFKFFVSFPIFEEVPREFMRDYRLLKNENDWMLAYLKKLDKNWNTNIVIKNACNWVTNNCNLNNKTSKEVVFELIKNNDKILDLFRLTVLSEEADFNQKLILTGDNFKENLIENYWAKARNDCNTDEWFFAQIAEAIKEIDLLQKEWRDWIDKWKEAWQLLIWNRPDEESKIEKEQLKKYLSNSWIPTERQDVIMKNLEEINSNWLSTSNNFIKHAIESNKKRLKEKIRLWMDETYVDFYEKQKKENIAINEINSITDTSKLSISIKQNIDKLYEDQLPFAWVWNIDTENIRAKLIKTHLSLEDSINTLEKTCEYSVKVCNDQDKSKWNCWSCN